MQLAISGIANGCVYGLIALGFVLIYKATEAINFAQGDMMMFGAFITLSLTNSNHMGLPFFIAVLIALLAMGLIGYALDSFVLRRIFGQSQIAVIILTIAIGSLFRFIAGLIWGHEPQSLESPLAGKDMQFGGLVLGLDEINQLAAYYMGIPVRRVHSLIWGLAGVVAAIAGILFASKSSIDPNTGLLGIKAFAAAVIGGFGSLPGALLGGLIIGLIEPFAARYGASGYSQIAPYLLLVLMLVFRPHGILSQVQSKKV